MACGVAVPLAAAELGLDLLATGMISSRRSRVATSLLSNALARAWTFPVPGSEALAWRRISCGSSRAGSGFFTMAAGPCAADGPEDGGWSCGLGEGAFFFAVSSVFCSSVGSRFFCMPLAELELAIATAVGQVVVDRLKALNLTTTAPFWRARGLVVPLARKLLVFDL